MRISDWSSDVCSSDLAAAGLERGRADAVPAAARGVLAGVAEGDARAALKVCRFWGAERTFLIHPRHSRESGNPVWDKPTHALGPRFRGDDEVDCGRRQLPDAPSPYPLRRQTAREPSHRARTTTGVL